MYVDQIHSRQQPAVKEPDVLSRGLHICCCVCALSTYFSTAHLPGHLVNCLRAILRHCNPRSRNDTHVHVHVCVCVPEAQPISPFPIAPRTSHLAPRTTRIKNRENAAKLVPFGTTAMRPNAVYPATLFKLVPAAGTAVSIHSSCRDFSPRQRARLLFHC